MKVNIINTRTNATDRDLSVQGADLYGNVSFTNNGFTVTQIAVPARSVTVSSGVAYLYITVNDTLYRVEETAATTVVSLGVNASGLTRIDIICLKFDTSVVSDPTGTLTASIVAVAGTAGAGVPATPANHYKISEVTLLNGYTTVLNADITSRHVGKNIKTGTLTLGESTATPTSPTSGNDTLWIDSLSNLSKVNSSGTLDYYASQDGWHRVNETWTFATSKTVTVTTDATTRFQKGDKVRLKQGAGFKYYYVIAITATVLTLEAGTDYTVANSAITEIYVSRATSPFGFPSLFTYTPTWTTSGTAPVLGNGTIIGFFNVDGSIVTNVVSLITGTTTTFGTGNFRFSTAFTIAGGANFANYGIGVCAAAVFTHTTFLNSTTTVEAYVNATGNVVTSTVPAVWTNGNYIRLSLQVNY